jgi:predicted Zn-dependent peptidase
MGPNCPFYFIFSDKNLATGHTLQASVYAGEPGISLSDPDCYALDVLASTLNGFGGTLFDELRTRQGLAYSVAGEHADVHVTGPLSSAPVVVTATATRWMCWRRR